MSSQQAAEIVDADVTVVPSKSIPQGLTALFQYYEPETLEGNRETMMGVLGDVVSGAMTHAVRDTSIDGVDIKSGAFIGLKNDKIVSSSNDALEVCQALLNEILKGDKEILTVIVGEDADDKVTSALTTWLEDTHPDVEVEVHQGKQPIYPYLFGAE